MDASGFNDMQKLFIASNILIGLPKMLRLDVLYTVVSSSQMAGFKPFDASGVYPTIVELK